MASLDILPVLGLLGALLGLLDEVFMLVFEWVIPVSGQNSHICLTVLESLSNSSQNFCIDFVSQFEGSIDGWWEMFTLWVFLDDLEHDVVKFVQNLDVLDELDFRILKFLNRPKMVFLAWMECKLTNFLILLPSLAGSASDLRTFFLISSISWLLSPFFFLFSFLRFFSLSASIRSYFCFLLSFPLFFLSIN